MIYSQIFLSPLRVMIIVAGILSLLACSSDDLLESNSPEPPPKVAISVVALNDFSVNEQVTVSLTASGKGQTTDLIYAWQGSPSITVNHPDTSVANATFMAPETTETLNYQFTVSATDGNGNVATDMVTVTIEPVNSLPDAQITYNQQSGYNTGQYPAGASIMLSGITSTDADAPTGFADIAAWRWQQLSGPQVLQGLSLNGSNLSVTPPILDPASTLVFSLIVTDQEGGTDEAEVTLKVIAASDTLPIVDAGKNQAVVSGETILLYGTASSVNPDAAPFSYRWLNDSALMPVITDEDAIITYAIAPKVAESDTATLSLQVTDALGHLVEESISVQVLPMPISRMNDTGVMLRASNSTKVSGINAKFPGQDADKGRDRITASGFIEKAGRGEGGFDFTRLDDIGDQVDDIRQPWRCVRDNVTGLVWEIKLHNLALQDNRNTYSWYQEDDAGGEMGNLNGADTSCTLAECNTTAYINAINTAGLCGFYDWRLPSHNELLSILHLGKTSTPLIDDEYFPYTSTGITPPVWYWTKGSSADGVAVEEAQNAWAIDFATGNDNFLNKSSAARVRLVRAGR
ncbi:DUF1566 domain-containing protein [Alteromonadaceae bacterium BrNp21-10]|nr:DUF1566 domain-containing protein [Alteromonadaceae bacterium BrNp21-10]